MDTHPPQVAYPPIPEGSPFLFEHQELPFAGDIHMEGEFLNLRDRFGVKTVIETGTCYGSSALWFLQHFERLITIEVNEQFAQIAVDRIKKAYPHRDPCVWLGSSEKQLPNIMHPTLYPDFKTQGPYLFFLDAHFEDHCPLLDELKAIADAGIKPVIVVHDVMVPGRKDLGYDTWNGQAFTYAWLRPSLEKIYGPNGFQHYFNHQATGAKRGCIFITPLP